MHRYGRLGNQRYPILTPPLPLTLTLTRYGGLGNQRYPILTPPLPLPLPLTRYGGLGNQRYPIGFSGDVMSSWASLAFQPHFTASAANVNFGYWSLVQP